MSLGIAGGLSPQRHGGDWRTSINGSIPGSKIERATKSTSALSGAVNSSYPVHFNNY